MAASCLGGIGMKEFTSKLEIIDNQEGFKIILDGAPIKGVAEYRLKSSESGCVELTLKINVLTDRFLIE